MTAVITKQNAKDGAFIGGNSSSNPNGEFDTINVKGDATIKASIEAGSMMIQEQVNVKGDATINGQINVKGDATIDGKIVNEQIDSIESRIKTLEDAPPDGLPFEDGLNDFIIDVNTLKAIETDECNIIEIGFETSSDYEGDVFELTFPSNMNLTKAIISV